ncbi:MAG: hypothetical protein ACI4VE_05705 [Clostridia bacterium]
MNVNFEAIEKAWFKPKKDIIKVNLNLKGIKNLENYITDLEQNRYVLDKLEEYINKEWNTIATSPDGSFYEGYDCCLEEMKKDILVKIQELKKENENGHK